MELVEMVDTWGLRSRWDRMSEPLCHASEASTATIHAEEVTGMREEADHGRKPDGRVRRVYDEPQPDDGTRVLVDRVWPRGLTKDKACLDLWFKQVTPSLLRKWYSHDPERFEAFGRRYREELKDERAHAPKHVRELARSGTLTLLTATKHAEISEAAVLADLIRGRAEPCRHPRSAEHLLVRRGSPGRPGISAAWVRPVGEQLGRLVDAAGAGEGLDQPERTGEEGAASDHRRRVP
jgi:uncharacterized protein YeaO (DUF488 family)